jgi:hypothetical protein
MAELPEPTPRVLAGHGSPLMYGGTCRRLAAHCDAFPELAPIRARYLSRPADASNWRCARPATAQEGSILRKPPRAAMPNVNRSPAGRRITTVAMAQERT